jgi:hypothetical protein
MTIAELDRWELQHGWGEAKRAKLKTFLQKYLVSFGDRALCSKWAEAVVSAHRNGCPIGLLMPGSPQPLFFMGFRWSLIIARITFGLNC